MIGLSSGREPGSQTVRPPFIFRRSTAAADDGSHAVGAGVPAGEARTGDAPAVLVKPASRMRVALVEQPDTPYSNTSAACPSRWVDRRGAMAQRGTSACPVNAAMPAVSFRDRRRRPTISFHVRVNRTGRAMISRRAYASSAG